MSSTTVTIKTWSYIKKTKQVLSYSTWRWNAIRSEDFVLCSSNTSNTGTITDRTEQNICWSSLQMIRCSHMYLDSATQQIIVIRRVPMQTGVTKDASPTGNSKRNVCCSYKIQHMFLLEKGSGTEKWQMMKRGAPTCWCWCLTHVHVLELEGVQGASVTAKSSKFWNGIP